MSNVGKSINLFLIDGEPTGRIKCTLANWTGIAYKLPRISLEKNGERGDLSQTGVYFLFGKSDETGEDMVYVGQARERKNQKGVLGRILEHKRNPNREYWTEAVVFVVSNNSFGPTEISYLENRFANMAVEAGRYKVKNENDPSSSNVTEEKQSELEEFISYAKLIVGTLGYRVFEPPIQTHEPLLSTAPEEESEPILYTKNKYADAKAKITNEGVVLLSGSKIMMTPTNSFPEYARKFREKYASFVSEDGITTKDILFSSPSGASTFVLGTPSSGNQDWKLADGLRLGGVNKQEEGNNRNVLPQPIQDDKTNKMNFFIKRGDVFATILVNDNKIVLLSGSKIRLTEAKSISQSVRKKRHGLKHLISEDGTITQDIEFNSPSAASGFVMGRTSNGNVEWIDENGKTFGEIIL